MMLAALLLALQDPAAAPSARDAQRAELRRDVARCGGAWKLHEWGHYFVITDVLDPTFLDQLERQAFEARVTCSRLFPEADGDPVRDDRKLAVLRVTKNRDEYSPYGGPGGSNGYWSPASNEIVIHDDPKREETWDALVGCVGYAFLDEQFGRSERAGWFEIGLAEFLSGAFRMRAADGLRFPGLEGRIERLRTADTGHWPALGEFLAVPRRDYYLREEGGPDRRLVAWTFMRFLCDERLHGPDFDPRWAKVHERYAVGSVTLEDEAKARDFAFEGLDLAVLERAWRASLTAK
jgi:hypothetical protein